MKDKTKVNYRRRLIAVVDYIYRHLNNNLDVNTLAEIANMSPYHFHRIYRQMAGETINATVRRQRLQQAAVELLRSDCPLNNIASNVGYGSPEAFSRAFLKEFEENPSDYRLARKNQQAPTFINILANSSPEYTDMFNVEMMETLAINLIGREHQGDYMEVGNTFGKLFMEAQSLGLLTEKTRSIGLYYCDPKTVATEDLRADACISIDQPIMINQGSAFKKVQIPAGKCATVLFKGSYAELEKPYDWLFGQWLPQSGYEAANFPAFEEYLNDPKTTPPSELLTRIYCLIAD